MGREVWEIVRADELKVGDVVSFSGDSKQWEIEYIRPGPTTLLYRCAGQDDTFWEDNDRHIFRRVSDADDPRVLRRAMENITVARDWTKDAFDQAIDQARKELESERQDGEKGA